MSDMKVQVRINGKNMWVNVSDVADAWGYASDSGDGYGQGILSKIARKHL